METLGRKLFGRGCRPTPTAAIDGYGTSGVELTLGLLEESALLRVDVQSAFEVILSIFRSSADVHQLNAGVDDIGKRLHVGIGEGGLAASRARTKAQERK